MSPHVVSTIALVAHGLIITGLTVRVITRRPPIGVALGWIAVICSLPVAGAFVYLMFGEKRLGRRRAARIAQQSVALGEWQRRLASAGRADAVPASDTAAAIVRQAETVLGFPALAGNRLELLTDFQSIFDRLVADIDAAQVRVHLCFYIWHAGGRVDDVIDALMRAAQRGVQVRALADGLGSKAFLRGRQAAKLRRAGIDLTVALPTGALRTLFARADLRNHRKIVVIDDHVAYSGSQNLVDPRFFKQSSGVGEWVDAMVRVSGPTVAALDAVFRLDFAVENGAEFDGPALAASVAPPADASVVQVVPSGPGLRPEAIHQLLLSAIYAARSELVMTTPYFVPDEAMLTALLTAALRGVAVTLIVPARNDSTLVRFASVAHFDELLDAGARIALFNGGLLHTKSLCIDRQVSAFGSVNLDMRSLWLNFEISLLIDDADFTARLRALQDGYLQNSDWLDLAAWRRRPRWRQFVENSCRLASPLL